MASSSNPNETPKRSVDEKGDPHREALGVLTGDMIRAYVNELDPPLIDPFSSDQLRAASYGLRLGDDYYQDGKIKQLSDNDRFVVIEPHEMAIITTHEFLHMPRYLIGRWNLRISLVYKGLLWAGAAQVDPGYYGNLFCPLYNLSNTSVAIERLDHIFTIDFVKTTPYLEEISPKYIVKRDKSKIGEYIQPYPLTSSVGSLSKKIDNVDLQATQREEKLLTSFRDLQSTVLIGLSTVFAGLTIVATLPYVTGNRLMLPPPDLYSGIHLALSVGAFIISIFAILRTRRIGKNKSK